MYSGLLERWIISHIRLFVSRCERTVREVQHLSRIGQLCINYSVAVLFVTVTNRSRPLGPSDAVTRRHVGSPSAVDAAGCAGMRGLGLLGRRQARSSGFERRGFYLLKFFFQKFGRRLTSFAL